jgi:crossover junction endodeoxyribonuclease RusA
MSVEIRFPLEFVVGGAPVSFQTKRRESLDEWKARVVEASRPVLPEGHFATPDALAITMFYFPPEPMSGDIDNIVKPILDALCRHIYMDDRQLHRVLIQKFEPGGIFQFAAPSAVLADAMGKPKPTLYIRLSNDLFEDLS